MRHEFRINKSEMCEFPKVNNIGKNGVLKWKVQIPVAVCYLYFINISYCKRQPFEFMMMANLRNWHRNNRFPLNKLIKLLIFQNLLTTFPQNQNLEEDVNKHWIVHKRKLVYWSITDNHMPPFIIPTCNFFFLSSKIILIIIFWPIF